MNSRAISTYGLRPSIGNVVGDVLSKSAIYSVYNSTGNPEQYTWIENLF